MREDLGIGTHFWFVLDTARRKLGGRVPHWIRFSYVGQDGARRNHEFAFN